MVGFAVMHPVKLSLLAPVLALLLVPAPPAAAQQPTEKRGPSTPEERAKAVELVRVLETSPDSPEAAQAREWLNAWLDEIPDMTVKYCLSLFGSREAAKALPQDLAMQHVYSAAAYLIQNPGRGPGQTETLVAGLQGTLRAYQALKAGKSPNTYPILEDLLQKDRSGTLDVHVRTYGRNCR